MKKMGIISDTHGLLREEVKTILTDCNAVIHCGDIDRQSIIDELKTIAPLYVVRGNADKDLAEDIPQKISEEIFGLRIFAIHNKKQITATDIENADIILYGHSHKYDEKTIDGKLWLNPGSCGKRRFSLPVTMAVIEVDENKNFNVIKKEFYNGEKTESANGITIDTVKSIMHDIEKNKSVDYISQKHKLSPELAEQICRLVLTHPGVDAEGVMKKMKL
jgi:hypothetical protein